MTPLGVATQEKWLGKKSANWLVTPRAPAFSMDLCWLYRKVGRESSPNAEMTREESWCTFRSYYSASFPAIVKLSNDCVGWFDLQ